MSFTGHFSPSYRLTSRPDSSDEIRTSSSRFTFTLPNSLTSASVSSTLSGADANDAKPKSSDFSISEISKKVMSNLRDKSPRCGLDIFSSATTTTSTSKEETNGQNNGKNLFP